MKYFILLLFFFIASILLGLPDTNAIKKKLEKSRNEDRISILNELSSYYYIRDDSAMFAKYGLEALKIARAEKNKYTEIDALNHLSFLYSWHNLEISDDYAKQALLLAEADNYEKGIAEAYFNRGLLLKMNKLSQKTDYYIKAINLSKNKYEFIFAIANAYLGEEYSSVNNFNEAVKYLITAQRAYDKILLTDSSIKTRYYYGELINSLGITYKNIGNIDDAERYYLKYMEISKSLNNYFGVGIAYNNLGNIYYRKRDLMNSVKYFNFAKEVFEKNGIENYSGTIYNNLGNIYADFKNYNEAEKNYKSAMALQIKSNNSTGLARALSNMADLRFTQKKLSDALKYYFHALKIANKVDEDIEMNCYSGLSQVYESMKNIPLAFKYNKLYQDIKDSLSEMSKSEEIGVITENYKNEKLIEEQKRKADEEQRVESDAKQRKYNLEYMGILIFLLFLFAAIFFLGKVKISTANLESIVFVALLFLFEFFMVFFDPYINGMTNGEPVYNLAINAVIALSLTPLDTFLEKIIRHKAIK